MHKYLLGILITFVLVFTGCTGNSGNGTQPSPKILRQTLLAGEYKMYQIEVTLRAGAELPLIIEMENGAKADGYFYVEKGTSDIAFEISGNSLIYRSDLTNIPDGQTASDRFSFTATQSQGSFYKMTLTNLATIAKNTPTTVFLEVIYPGADLNSTLLEN